MYDNFFILMLKNRSDNKNFEEAEDSWIYSQVHRKFPPCSD
jgi:hypothetical protein